MRIRIRITITITIRITITIKITNSLMRAVNACTAGSLTRLLANKRFTTPVNACHSLPNVVATLPYKGLYTTILGSLYCQSKGCRLCKGHRRCLIWSGQVCSIGSALECQMKYPPFI